MWFSRDSRDSALARQAFVMRCLNPRSSSVLPFFRALVDWARGSVMFWVLGALLGFWLEGSAGDFEALEAFGLGVAGRAGLEFGVVSVLTRSLRVVVVMAKPLEGRWRSFALS